MVATCGAGAMLYMLPMLLGRTYNMKSDSVGVDIFYQKDIDDAINNPVRNPEVRSYYMTVQDASEKRDFLGVSGEISLKVASGLVDIRGAGEYMRDTSNALKSVEILIKVTFTTETRTLNRNTAPVEDWYKGDPDLLGTHVINSITLGGEVYASVNFVAAKESYLQDIKAEVDATISKSGTFDINAQGKLEMLAQNLSSKAKMEIDYYGTVPLEDVPTTIEGLRRLVNHFKDQVENLNNGVGVAVCVGFIPLSHYNSTFTFTRNRELMNALENFNYKLDNLRVAKSMTKSFISHLPDEVPEQCMQKLMDYYERLSQTYSTFYEVIVNLNMEEGSNQLNPANEAFDENSKVSGVNKYTKEIKRLMSECGESVLKATIKPRALYTNWGKRTCDNKASNIVHIGFMASDVEAGIGGGTNYQCLPENPRLKMDFDITGLNAKTSRLAAVRYNSMSIFKNSRQLQDNVVPCVICETPMRTTVKMFPGTMSCPGNWVQEYRGYLASNAHGRLRAEHVCVNREPDTYKGSKITRGDPVLVPVKIGATHNDKIRRDASIPCVVCSK